MAVVRPFRAVRPDPARVDLGSIVAAADISRAAAATAVGRDPRSLAQLLFVDEPRAAAFLLLDLQRAGVLVTDRAPSLTVVRVVADGQERTSFFAALRADSVDAVDAADRGDVVMLDTGVAPIVVSFADKKGRISRAMEAETEREPDADFAVDGVTVEVWIVDDDSAAARLASLVEGAALTVVGGTDMLARAQQRAAQHPWALACFVDDEHPPGFVPVGVCLLPAANAV